MSRSRNTPAGEQGFALVVIAALFVAFAVIAAVVIERNSTTQQITRRDVAAAQLTRISNAIIQYSIANATSRNLYPCPARLDVAVGDSTFGQSVQTPNYPQNCSNVGGDVAGSYPSTPATTISGYLHVLNVASAVAGGPVVRGMVPVQALADYGIGAGDAFDPWNNRIMYIVNRSQTFGSSSPSNTGNPTINDPISGLVLADADFILVSYGRDGVGGYSRSSTSVSNPCAGTLTILRKYNCDNDTIYSQAPTYTYSNAASTEYFDDILSYYRQ